MKTIGIISDTHGLLRPEACELLIGSDLIIHGGDIGKPEIVEQLLEIAPVKVIRGNIDKSNELKLYPDTEAFEYESKFFYVIHDLKELDLDPSAGGFDIVVSGHSHIPRIEEKDNVLYINPGSSGPRRFKLPVTLAILKFDSNSQDVSIETVIN